MLMYPWNQMKLAYVLPDPFRARASRNLVRSPAFTGTPANVTVWLAVWIWIQTTRYWP